MMVAILQSITRRPGRKSLFRSQRSSIELVHPSKEHVSWEATVTAGSRKRPVNHRRFPPLLARRNLQYTLTDIELSLCADWKSTLLSPKPDFVFSLHISSFGCSVWSGKLALRGIHELRQQWQGFIRCASIDRTYPRIVRDTQQYISGSWSMPDRKIKVTTSPGNVAAKLEYSMR